MLCMKFDVAVVSGGLVRSPPEAKKLHFIPLVNHSIIFNVNSIHELPCYSPSSIEDSKSREIFSPVVQSS